MKSTHFRRAVIGGLGGLGVMCHRGARVWRSLLQTLLVATGCGGVLGLLSGRARHYPGSPRLGSADPGLYYAAPLGLVCGGVVGVGGDNVWRGLLWTLLGDAGGGGVLGLLSGCLRSYPGSPRLGSADPGLCYAAPLGLVWCGVECADERLDSCKHVQKHSR